MQVCVIVCKAMQVCASACKFVQVVANICKNIQVCVSNKFAQENASFCKQQVFARKCKFVQFFQKFRVTLSNAWTSGEKI